MKRRWKELLLIAGALALASALVLGVEMLVGDHVGANGHSEAVVQRLEVVVVIVLVASYLINDILSVCLSIFIRPLVPNSKPKIHKEKGLGFREVLILLSSLAGSAAILSGFKYLSGGS